MQVKESPLITSFKCALNFAIYIVFCIKVLDLLMEEFICVPCIAFCVDKFQPCGLVNHQNNVFSLTKFTLSPLVSDIGRELRMTGVCENIRRASRK